ncbi:MAG: dynamin family protein [Ruminococcus sp.]|nr:dynamin family protein [Ruminococcus sp.]
MSIESTISDFYSSIEKAGQILSEYQKDIDEKQDLIKKYITELTPAVLPENSGNSEFSALCEKLFTKHNRAISMWQNQIDKYISGKEFVNKFEKSLLLIVFADVKAGKSTLGNFISGYAFKGTPYEYLYTSPVCYAYDYTDKSLNCGEETVLKDGYFVEDEIQATASIQYFTLLGGLTWVDTPGIHSLTTEYEELAKDYVKYADLILFLTPSNNPIKQDESYEISKLVKCDKPMLVTITKSDITKKGVSNGKLVTILEAKSPQDRAAQESYTEEKIGEIGRSKIISQNKYISVSTRIAKKALAEKNEEFFEKSNFPAFFEQIGSIISEKAIALKMKRPKDELNSVIGELIDGNERFAGIRQLKANISDFVKDIETQSNRMLQLKPIILSEVISEIDSRIYTFLYNEKMSGRLNQNNYIENKIGALISEVIGNVITEIIAREIADFQAVQIENVHIVINADFQIKKQKIEYQVQSGRTINRAPKGIIENIQHIFFGKNFEEYSVRNVNKCREIEIGDNFNEYSQTVINSLKPQITEIINAEIIKVQNQNLYQ